MKNLFLIGCMLLSFSIASAQDTIQGKKRSSTKTDTVHHKKSKQHPSTKRTDAQPANKKGTTKSTNKTTRDTINSTKP